MARCVSSRPEERHGSLRVLHLVDRDPMEYDGILSQLRRFTGEPARPAPTLAELESDPDDIPF